MFNDASEEEEPEELFPDTEKREEASIGHETKKEREEKLRKMMEDDGTVSHPRRAMGNCN